MHPIVEGFYHASLLNVSPIALQSFQQFVHQRCQIWQNFLFQVLTKCCKWIESLFLQKIHWIFSWLNPASGILSLHPFVHCNCGAWKISNNNLGFEHWSKSKIYLPELLAQDHWVLWKCMAAPAHSIHWFQAVGAQQIDQEQSLQHHAPPSPCIHFIPTYC